MKKVNVSSKADDARERKEDPNRIPTEKILNKQSQKVPQRSHLMPEPVVDEANARKFAALSPKVFHTKPHLLLKFFNERSRSRS